MYKLAILATLLFVLSANDGFGQKKKKQKKSEKEVEALLAEIEMDSTYFLKDAGKRACDCIDSVAKAKNNYAKTIEDISACIDGQVGPYQLMTQMAAVLKSPKKNNEILMSSKGSESYRTTYYEIERWLKANCTVMNEAIASNDDPGDYSISQNKEAYSAYERGVQLMKAQKFSECIPWFEKAVAIDSMFVFAWDNLGVSHRRLGELDKAEAAYKRSLSIQPSGKTALQNIAVVYMHQGKADQAINAYADIQKFYPGDPEAYYGISIVYLESKKNLHLALDYMCKAYNQYIELKSPYRSDAEKVINIIYKKMAEDKKEEDFKRILAENNIRYN